eukprot:jgi/Tetstr1/454573/TSEL_041468.t1
MHIPDGAFVDQQLSDVFNTLLPMCLRGVGHWVVGAEWAILSAGLRGFAAIGAAAAASGLPRRAVRASGVGRHEAHTQSVSTRLID